MSKAHEEMGNLWWVLALSLSYLIAEVIGGLYSGSLALLADAGHMAIDVAAIALGIFAIWIAARPPNDQKTFGYYRAEILAALVNGATLMAISLWILVEAFHRWQEPRPIIAPVMTLVALGGLCINLIALKLTHKNKNESLNVRGVWLHILSDTLGSVSAIVGGVVVWKWGWTRVDPVVSVFVSLLILGNSWRLLSEAVNILLEAVPKGMNLAEIREALKTLEGVSEVHDLHVWTVSSRRHALSAHIRLHTERDHARVLKEATALLEARFKIYHATLQVEPPSFSHGAMGFSRKCDI